MLVTGSLLLLVLSLFVVAGGGFWLLLKDRDYWRRQFTELQAQSRTREEALFDQMLRGRGAKPLNAKVVEEKPVAPSPPDLAEYADRLQERVEAGVLTQQQADYLLDDARNGAQTADELNRSLWMSRSEGNLEF